MKKIYIRAKNTEFIISQKPGIEIYIVQPLTHKRHTYYTSYSIQLQQTRYPKKKKIIKPYPPWNPQRFRWL